MRPNLHPSLVNGRFGDPALYVERLHQKGALLFDLGDLAPLSARDLLRVEQVFVTHAHMDHFVGFDALLRVHVGREKSIGMVGPKGFTDRVHHKLHGYEWDLVDRYDADLVFDVDELDGETLRSARFRFKTGFSREERPERALEDDIVCAKPGYRVEAAVLDHHGPCLGFAVSEPVHVNIWKSRLDARGFSTGPWLQALKQAVIEAAPDDRPIALPDGRTALLGQLRDLVTIGRGQKIAYVTDVADTPDNRRKIVRLAEEADTLFIESRFAAAATGQAAERAHLTTTAAGEIARAAGARKVEPFHFSPRYEGEEDRMVAEVTAAFLGS